jgi:site-specific DNA recombinase
VVGDDVLATAAGLERSRGLGTIAPGATPLIDVTTFEKVQEVLDTARLSGNRTRKHKHYLRGSLFCGFCGRRMVFHRIRGRGGLYDYFGCLSHQGRRGDCGSRYLQVENVERAVERYYARVRLTQDEREAIRQAGRAVRRGAP